MVLGFDGIGRVALKEGGAGLFFDVAEGIESGIEEEEEEEEEEFTLSFNGVGREALCFLKECGIGFCLGIGGGGGGGGVGLWVGMGGGGVEFCLGTEGGGVEFCLGMGGGGGGVGL